MKIYILPVDKEFQPEEKVLYPKHHDDYGVEQDFLTFMNANPEYTTQELSQANCFYLPIFWTRWHVQHDYGKRGLDILQKYSEKLAEGKKNIFTICQYDDGPLVDIPQLKVFSSARKDSRSSDIPLLSKKHRLSLFKPSKKYLASFVGRLSTHSIRTKMRDALIDVNSIKIIDSETGEKLFVNTTRRSYVALCPRGYGGNSFRFYEAMQMGVVPMLIGDIDTRPFKKNIDWDTCSFYTNDANKIDKLIHSKSERDLEIMGIKAKKIFDTSLSYGKWPNYVINELENFYG